MAQRGRWPQPKRTSNIERPTSNIQWGRGNGAATKTNVEHRTPNIEHPMGEGEWGRNQNEHRTSNAQHRTSNGGGGMGPQPKRTSNIERPTSNIELGNCVASVSFRGKRLVILRCQNLVQKTRNWLIVVRRGKGTSRKGEDTAESGRGSVWRDVGSSRGIALLSPRSLAFIL